MHIVVVTKSTPDGNAKIAVDSSGKVTWGGQGLVLNPWDEYAVTEALLLKEAHNVKVTVIVLGTEEQNEALKHSLAMGADEAIRIWDDALADHDTLQYSRAIAAAVKKLGDVDLILFGKELMDSYTDQHVYQVGRLLGWNVLGSMKKIQSIDFNTKTVKIDRIVEQGKQTLTSKLPAVMSLFDDINEPKYPSFMGIRKASKAVIPVWGQADLGADLGAPAVKVVEFTNLPERAGEVEMIDGESAAQKAEALVTKLMEAKLL